MTTRKIEVHMLFLQTVQNLARNMVPPGQRRDVLSSRLETTRAQPLPNRTSLKLDTERRVCATKHDIDDDESVVVSFS